MFPNRRRRRDSLQEEDSSQVGEHTRDGDKVVIHIYIYIKRKTQTHTPCILCNDPHRCTTGPAGFPGGVPGGMPGLGEFLKDPELILAMNVTRT